MSEKIVQLNEEVIKGQIKEVCVTKSLARGAGSQIRRKNVLFKKKKLSGYIPRRTQPSAVSRRSASRTADQSVSDNIGRRDGSRRRTMYAVGYICPHSACWPSRQKAAASRSNRCPPLCCAPVRLCLIRFPIMVKILLSILPQRAGCWPSLGSGGCLPARW